MTAIAMLWRRLDTPGHDACCLQKTDDGWHLDGTAVFLHEGVPARLGYQLVCDPSWRTRHGNVRGWVGARPVEITVMRTADGTWTVNDIAVPGLETYVDLDLGFTPATNVSQLRRVALAEGEAADVTVAWLDVTAGTLAALPLRYERRTAATYWSEAPSVDYAGLLEVTAAGFIRKYPGLWETEPAV